MSRRQFGFLMGFLIVWLAWVASWVVLAAVIAGGIGWLVVSLLEGGVDLESISARFRDESRRR
jgi:amino acid transporter